MLFSTFSCLEPVYGLWTDKKKKKKNLFKCIFRTERRCCLLIFYYFFSISFLLFLRFLKFVTIVIFSNIKSPFFLSSFTSKPSYSSIIFIHTNFWQNTPSSPYHGWNLLTEHINLTLTMEDLYRLRIIFFLVYLYHNYSLYLYTVHVVSAANIRINSQGLETLRVLIVLFAKTLSMSKHFTRKVLEVVEHGMCRVSVANEKRFSIKTRLSSE